MESLSRFLPQVEIQTRHCALPFSIIQNYEETNGHRLLSQTRKQVLLISHVELVVT